jgi:hypothetical protein
MLFYSARLWFLFVCVDVILSRGFRPSPLQLVAAFAWRRYRRVSASKRLLRMTWNVFVPGGEGGIRTHAAVRESYAAAEENSKFRWLRAPDLNLASAAATRQGTLALERVDRRPRILAVGGGILIRTGRAKAVIAAREVHEADLAIGRRKEVSWIPREIGRRASGQDVPGEDGSEIERVECLADVPRAGWAGGQPRSLPTSVTARA